MLQAPLTYLLAFIAALGVLVVVHEFGHFIVARLCGVKVLRFAVGFGQVLWSRKAGPDQTEWALCAIPLGGYVKMLDEREGPVEVSELHRAFTRKSLGQRSLIVLAGPVANLLLAIVLYSGLFMHGVEDLRPILAAPKAETPAAQAGVRLDDLVTAVNGRAIRGWEELRWGILRDLGEGQTTRLQVRGRDGEVRDLVLPTNQVGVDSLDRDPLKVLGLSVALPDLPPIIGRVLKDTPAERADIRVGDKVVAINGVPVSSWSTLAETAHDAPGRKLGLTLEREGALMQVDVVPDAISEKDGQVGRIGVAPKEDPAVRAAMFTTVAYAPGQAIAKAVRQTWESAVFTLRIIGRMITGELSLKNLSGPVTIADYAGQSVQLGMPYYVKFLSIISISIGILNLLPIPVLDGGHLMYYLAEFLRGKPLPERVFALGQRIGLTFLLLMMGVALFNDLNRQFFG